MKHILTILAICTNLGLHDQESKKVPVNLFYLSVDKIGPSDSIVIIKSTMEPGSYFLQSVNVEIEGYNKKLQ